MSRHVSLDEDSFHTLVGYPVIKLDDTFVVHGPRAHRDALKPAPHRHEVRLPNSVYKAIEGCFWTDDGIHFTFECQDLPARFTMSTEQLGDLVALLEKRAGEIDVDYLSMDNPPLYRTLRQMRKTTDRLRSEYEWWKRDGANLSEQGIMRKICVQLDPNEHSDLLEGLASLSLWLGDPNKHLEDQGQDKIPVWPKAGLCNAFTDSADPEWLDNAKKGAQLRGFVLTLLGGIGVTPNKPTNWFPMADLMELTDLIGWAAKTMRDVAVELDKSMEVPPSFRHASALFAAPFWEEGWTTDGMGPISQNWAGHLTSMINLQTDLLDVAHAGHPVESYRELDIPLTDE